MSLLVPARSYAPEIMDRADNSVDALREALCDLDWSHRWLGGARALRLAVAPVLRECAPDRTIELLDIATGGADLPRTLLEAGAKLGRRIRVTALDRDPITARLAAESIGGERRIRVLRADAFDLPFRDGTFDLATVSLFLHHLEHERIVELLGRLGRIARRAVIVSDLRRHRVSRALIRLVAGVTRRGQMFRHDAPLSILRGFTAAELRRAAEESGATEICLERRWPFRWVMTLRPE